MKIALVYDRVNKFGGAERVLKAFHQIFPKAPLYTAVYNKKTTPWANNFDIHPSFLNKFPLAKSHHELYPLLTTLAFESFDFSDYDLVISITSAEAKAVITHPKTLHLCYCLTPTRYLWSHKTQYLNHPGLGPWSHLGKLVFKFSKQYLKQVDLITSSRPDQYLAISKAVQKRIKKYYYRDSKIIHPPVNTANFYHNKPKDYYLLVSRLVPYKNIDIAIKAFNKLNKKLVIIGIGRELKNLKKLANSNISFLGKVSDLKLADYYSYCRALIMPQEEDFGLVSLEAQSSGKPVIALNQGGAKDTVINNKTGILFNQATVDSLIKAVKQFNTLNWNHLFIQKNAKKFDTKIFQSKIKNFVEEQWQIKNQ
ncbi:MAG: glycosyltransferase [Patescibacteria group bacterium]|nr:glycosyltransferase [Patescibacteria group bacterium]